MNKLFSTYYEPLCLFESPFSAKENKQTFEKVNALGLWPSCVWNRWLPVSTSFSFSHLRLYRLYLSLFLLSIEISCSFPKPGAFREMHALFTHLVFSKRLLSTFTMSYLTFSNPLSDHEKITKYSKQANTLALWPSKNWPDLRSSKSNFSDPDPVQETINLVLLFFS